ncbi:MAG: tetratricopeptide repeat protein [Acidobacteria bacterium]|nr:tetratricopeptide repeat protein [Acidobacteriota bacterium]
MIYLLFLLSGISGLIYQVVWVRVFGNVFGNTIYSASIILAVFMLGLGVGSYVVGAWADRRYTTRPDSLLRAYGHVELIIALMGLGIAAVLPHLGALSAFVSSYAREPSGWYALSTASYLARTGIAVVLLTPITLLMGGTLTLLIRHLVRSEIETGGWKIALLYGINTAGAALGCVLADFALVPASGLWGAQMVAVFFNVVAGAGALLIASRSMVRLKPDTTKKKGRSARDVPRDVRSVRLQPDPSPAGSAARHPAYAGSPTRQPRWGAVRGAGAAQRTRRHAVALTSVALAMTGLAAMGMEILWFRHFSMLLGGFRAVFSLLLAVILIGIGIGSCAGGVLYRRTGMPAVWFMVVQGLFVAATLVGLATADVRAIDAVVRVLGGSSGAAPTGTSALAGTFAELWFNARPMLMEVAVPAVLMGFSFPLANAMVQRAELSVGRRAGILYFANTTGAVCGSLATGLVLLPVAGLQLSATMLMGVAALAVVPLYFATRSPLPDPRSPIPALGGSLLLAGGALVWWLQLPADYVTGRTVVPGADERLLVVSDGLTEVIAVTEAPGKGRKLMTNGHAMSATFPLSQRYMRALAHVPLLSMDAPETVLVIGFGVGNTTQAATLHPTVRRVDLADLSRDILAHAGYFRNGNRDVLNDPKLTVHINDGRQHLQMQPRGAYDLIALEPPPIAYAGVGALYSKEFYTLARSRLTPDGYISQWLPAYQVPPPTTLAMIRAFVDVFPQSVLLSGAESDLILLGTSGPRIDIDPVRVARSLARAPAVQMDLDRIHLGRVHEIVGTFVGSARTLDTATRDVEPVTDDRPLQEYGVRSLLNFGRVVPGEVVDLSQVGEWCSRCVVDGSPAPPVRELDTYLSLLGLAYSASPREVAQAKRLAEREGRVIAGSAYLGEIVPESAELHNLLGIARASAGRLDEAVAEFSRAVDLDPGNAPAHWHLGAALASQDRGVEALVHLQRSVQLDPGNGRAHEDLGVMLARDGRLDEAAVHFQHAIDIDPESADARRNLALVGEQQARSQSAR